MLSLIRGLKSQKGLYINSRVCIPDELIPDDAKVEMDAKKVAGYFTVGTVPTKEELNKKKGRDF